MTLNVVKPIIKGDGTIELVFTVTTDVNFTGATVKWSARNYEPPNAVVLSKTGTIVSIPLKQFSIALTKSDTAALEGLYYHDATIIDAGNNEITVRNDDGSPGILEFQERITVV